MAITKNDLIDLLYERLGNFTKPQCSDLVESVLATMKDELAAGHDLKISGFGKWMVRDKKARKGRNPATGEEITIEARRVVSFKASLLLVEELNPEKKHERGV